MKKLFICLAFAAICSISASSVQAAFVFAVNNTGLGAVETEDSNWKYAFSATEVSTTDPSLTFANSIVSNPRPVNWVANSATSKWVSPTADQSFPGPGNPPGWYYFQTTFNLTGFDPSTASFNFRWATDNSATLFLNGVSTGFTRPDSAFSSFTSALTVNTGFVSGLNTLTLKVLNSGDSNSPTGARFEFLSTSAVPEPASAALFLLGVPAIGLVFRGRRAAV
jgi:hypothetical protein